MALPVSQGGIDYPDGGFSSGSGVFPMAGDLGELAARLGSIATYNREGNVVAMETFSRGASLWSESPYGTGAEVVVSAERALSPPYSLKLVTGSDGFQGIKTSYQAPFYVLSKFGLEYAFAHHLSLTYHIFHLYIRDGATRYEYFIRFDVQGGNLAVYVPGATWTTFATGLNLKSDGWLFHRGKLVVDGVNNEYVRFLYDNLSYDLSDYSPNTASDTEPPYLEAAVQMQTDVGSNLSTYIDNVIITRNEPSH